MAKLQTCGRLCGVTCGVWSERRTVEGGAAGGVLAGHCRLSLVRSEGY